MGRRSQSPCRGPSGTKTGRAGLSIQARGLMTQAVPTGHEHLTGFPDTARGGLPVPTGCIPSANSPGPGLSAAGLWDRRDSTRRGGKSWRSSSATPGTTSDWWLTSPVGSLLPKDGGRESTTGSAKSSGYLTSPKHLPPAKQGSKETTGNAADSGKVSDSKPTHQLPSKSPNIEVSR